MKKSELGERACSVARALDAVGDSWSLLMIRELFLGTRRFEEFQAQTGASPTIVSRRLQRLVEQGIVRRKPYQQNPPRDEFHLTRKGLDLWPVIVTLMEFGDRWQQGPGRTPLVIRHDACGHETQPQLVCSHCGEALHAPDTTAEIGPVLQRDRDAMCRRMA